MATRAIVFALICLLVVDTANSTACAGETNWVEKRCAAYRGDYCRVPFSVAMAHPEELMGMLRVQLRGYLVRESNGYALYESRESALRGWRSDAVLITEPATDEIEKSLQRWNESLVRIRGRIVLEALDYDEYWVRFELDSPVSAGWIRGEALKR
jgi:hypothetical protein